MDKLTKLREKKAKQKGLRVTEWKLYANLLQQEIESYSTNRDELIKEYQRVSNVINNYEDQSNKKPQYHSSKMQNMTTQLWKETNDVTKEHRIPLERIVGLTFIDGNS